MESWLSLRCRRASSRLVYPIRPGATRRRARTACLLFFEPDSPGSLSLYSSQALTLLGWRFLIAVHLRRIGSVSSSFFVVHSYPYSYAPYASNDGQAKRRTHREDSDARSLMEIKVRERLLQFIHEKGDRPFFPKRTYAAGQAFLVQASERPVELGYFRANERRVINKWTVSATYG